MRSNIVVEMNLNIFISPVYPMNPFLIKFLSSLCSFLNFNFSENDCAYANQIRSILIYILVKMF